MWNTAGGVRTKSYVFFHGTLYMDVPVLLDQLELTYKSSARTQDTVKKTGNDG